MLAGPVSARVEPMLPTGSVDQPADEIQWQLIEEELRDKLFSPRVIPLSAVRDESRQANVQQKQKEEAGRPEQLPHRERLTDTH
jgi:hypothetical protein